MVESWRVFLYPIGFLAQIAFTGRFFLQWLDSERRGKSVVTSTFWQISLFGNLIMYVHSLIQMQFHVCLAQALNGVLAWRNIDLMRAGGPRWTLRSIPWLLAISSLATVVLFFLEDWLCGGGTSWFRVPTFFQKPAQSVSLGWNVLGCAGLLLFHSRFWVQWFFSEEADASQLGKLFWYQSLCGALLSGVYFFYIQDMVNLSGFVLCLVPYVRNLMMLANKTERTA